MKKLTIVICLLCLFVEGPALADPHGVVEYGGRIYYSQQTGYASGSGGEFTIYSAPPPGPGLTLSNLYYSTDTKDVYMMGSFQTFCVEMDEYINPNPSDIYVSESWVDGSMPGSHAYGGGKNTDSGDNLDPLTAYLYTQFAKGVLSDYVYTPGPLREDSAVALQTVIWGIEEELGSLWTPDAGLQETFYDDAVDAFAAGWTGIGDVRMLQFVTTDGRGLKQDQLYLTPIPASVVLGMLGLGVVGLKLRKFA